MITATKPQRVQLFAGGLIAAAALWPLSPVHPPIACPLLSATGVPCPMCGMTRAGVSLARGRVGDALAFNPGIVVIVALLATALVRPDLILKIKPPVWLLVVGFGALWIWNVGFNPTFTQWLL
jgi:hypothetical protein